MLHPILIFSFCGKDGWHWGDIQKFYLFFSAFDDNLRTIILRYRVFTQQNMWERRYALHVRPSFLQCTRVYQVPHSSACHRVRMAQCIDKFAHQNSLCVCPFTARISSPRNVQAKYTATFGLIGTSICACIHKRNSCMSTIYSVCWDTHTTQISICTSNSYVPPVIHQPARDPSHRVLILPRRTYCTVTGPLKTLPREGVVPEHWSRCELRQKKLACLRWFAETLNQQEINITEVSANNEHPKHVTSENTT
eukprot:284815885_3